MGIFDKLFGAKKKVNINKEDVSEVKKVKVTNMDTPKKQTESGEEKKIFFTKELNKVKFKFQDLSSTSDDTETRLGFSIREIVKNNYTEYIYYENIQNLEDGEWVSDGNEGEMAWFCIDNLNKKFMKTPEDYLDHFVINEYSNGHYPIEEFNSAIEKDIIKYKITDPEVIIHS